MGQEPRSSEQDQGLSVSLSLSPCKMISCRWTSLDLHLTQKMGAWDSTLSPFVDEDTDLVWNKAALEDRCISIKKKDYLFIKRTFWNVKVAKLRIKCLVPLWSSTASGPYSWTQMGLPHLEPWSPARFWIITRSFNLRPLTAETSITQNGLW